MNRLASSPSLRTRRLALSWLGSSLLAACGPGVAITPAEDAGASHSGPSWLVSSSILLSAPGPVTADCRAGDCRHNENTDMITWGGAIRLVHRTAISQKLGDNSSLLIYRSDDNGATFTRTARIVAESGRDIRDPHWFVVGDELCLKALARLPVNLTRDTGVDTVALRSCTSDGVTFSDWQEIGPHGWSFWRPQLHDGVYYTAAYQDGDLQVVLFSSTDGATFTAGPLVYGVSADTPLETELSFVTEGGRMLALVRTDGTDAELAGDVGRLRTQTCWSDPPYAEFTCKGEIDGERLDGPLSFFHDGHLFEIARRHLPGQRKRTTLFRIDGDLTQGPLAATPLGDFPSGGDTAYAGATALPDGTFVVSWYSGDVGLDEAWLLGMYDQTDIWTATIDLAGLSFDPTP